MKRLLWAAALVMACCAQITVTSAASLRVAPVVLNLKPPSAASSIRIWNDDSRPINVQIRIFKWSQRNGHETYEATDDVVASPPITDLQPGAENLIRVVRTSKRPIQEEESYRMIVDELPDPSRAQNSTVVLVVRHSIPVFISPAEAARANPTWSVKRIRDGYQVGVENTGTQRLKVSNLVLSDHEKVLGKLDGLVGYVLGNTAMSWVVPATASGYSGDTVTISADSESGRFDATARIGG